MENSQKPHTKTVAGLISFIVLLALAVLGLVMAYYFQSDHVASLEYQVASLKTSAEDARKEAKENGDTPAAATYREIPELGVKYKITDQVKDLTYQYLADDKGRFESVRLTTKALTRLKDSKDQNPCATSMPSGTILRQTTAPLANDPRLVSKKIGNYYFMYAAPEIGCMVDTQEAPNFQESVNAVKAAYDALEAM